MKLLKLNTFLVLLGLLTTILSGQLLAAETGSITGTVYCDHDKNGICDCEETGLKDIPILIFVEHCGGTPLQTVATDEKGNFAFGNVNPGAYFVMVDLDYVCGGRVPTTRNCQQVKIMDGEVVNLPAFGYSEFGQ